jgi:TolA-binding protein
MATANSVTLMKTVLSLIFYISLLLAFAACSENEKERSKENLEEFKTESSETVKKASEALRTEKEQFSREMREKLSGIEGKITELKKDLNRGTSKGKQTTEEELKKLEKKRLELQDELSRAGDKAESEWKEFKENIKRSVNELEKDLDDNK